MSIELKTIPMGPAITPALPTIDADAVERRITETTMQVIENNLRYMDSRFGEMRREFSAELSKISRPSQVVVAVELSGITHKLSKTVSAGRAKLLGRLVTNAKLGLCSMLYGPAGSGKTTLSMLLADSIGARTYACLSMSLGASETWLFGRWKSSNGDWLESAFCEIYENGGVFMLDEVDAADANTLIILNNALENGQFYNPIAGRVYKQHPDFVLVAGGNTAGTGATDQYSGRSRLDFATLQRFIKIPIKYDLELEKELCPDNALLEKLWSARIKLTELRARVTITTRDIKNAYLQKANGIDESDVFESIASVFPDGLASQCGLVA